MSEEKLKPCPFCGSIDHLMVERLEGTIQRPAYRVKCDNCGSSSAYCDNGSHVELWNTRHDEAN